MVKNNKGKERGYYKPLSIRLGELEKQELKNLKGDKSWNMFFRELIDERRDRLKLTKIIWKHEKRKETM